MKVIKEQVNDWYRKKNDSTFDQQSKKNYIMIN